MNHRILFLAALPFAVSSLATAQSQPAGFYAGGSLGATRAKSESTVALGGGWASESSALRNDLRETWAKDLDANGFEGTLHVGYRHRLPQNFVLSGELSLGILSAKDSLSTGQVPTDPFPSLTYALDTEVKVSTPIALTAKLGYAIDRHLPYLTLGYAQAKVEASNQVISNGDYRKLASASERKGGFQWGLGYEYTLDAKWSLYGEFTSVRLGDLDVPSVYLPGSTFTSPAYTETFTHKVTLNTLRVGANYRF